MKYAEVQNTTWNNGGKAFRGEIVRIQKEESILGESEKGYLVNVCGTGDTLVVRKDNLRPIETSGFTFKISKEFINRRQGKKNEVGDDVILLEVNEDETKVLIKNLNNHFIGWVSEDKIVSKRKFVG